MLLQFHSIVQEIASPIPKQQPCESIICKFASEIKLYESLKEKKGTGCGLGEMND